MRSQLFAQSDTFLFIVEVKDNNVDLLTAERFLPDEKHGLKKGSDVDQTVYATQVDEYTARSDVLHSSFQYLSFSSLEILSFFCASSSASIRAQRYNNAFGIPVIFTILNSIVLPMNTS